MTRIAFDESAYYQLKTKFGDNSYKDINHGNSDFEELPPETQILLLKHTDFKDLIQLEFLTKPTVSARSEVYCPVAEAVSLIGDSVKYANEEDG